MKSLNNVIHQYFIPGRSLGLRPGKSSSLIKVPVGWHNSKHIPESSQLWGVVHLLIKTQ